MSMEILDDPTLIFRKRPGTTNKGSDYENLLIAHLALSLTTEETVKDFKISSNDANFGTFDDVVLEIESIGEIQKYAIQLKHSNGRILTKNSLTEANGNFSIKKYLDEYKKLKNVTDFKFVLYTNRKFDISDKETTDRHGRRIQVEHNKLKIDNVEITIEEKSEMALNTGHCFKFVPDQPEEFFGKFFLYTDQTDVDGLKKQIETDFQRKFNSYNYAYKEYVDFITQWSSSEGKKTKLCKSLIRHKITMILLSSFAHPLEPSGICVTPKMQLLRDTIIKSQTMCFSKDQKDELIGLWPGTEYDSQEASNLKHFYQICTEDAQNLGRNMLSWLMHKCPLIVDDSSTTRAAISLCPGMIFIILGNCKDRKLSSLSPDILNDLTPLRCCLQGKEDISLQSLIGGGQLLKHITTDELVKMSNSILSIGEKEVLPIPHITRSLTRHILDWTVLNRIDFGLANDDFVVITNYQMCDQMKHKTLNSDNFLSVKETNWEFCKGKVIFVTDKEYSQEEFDEICYLNGDKSKYHQFRLVEDQLEWVRSRGGICDLTDFLLSGQCLTESELSKYESDNRIHIVCAGPGMGKTTLMKSVKNNTSPTSWTVLIYARNYSGCFKDKSTFTEHVLSEIDDMFERKLVEILIKENRVKYIWDGLDEVSDQNFELVMNLIEELSNTGVTQWITSRDNLKDVLESRFGILSRTVKEFDEEEQKTYVKDRLECNDNLDDIFEKIKKNIRLFPGNNILGIPLQIYLLTELLCHDQTRYNNLLDNIFSLTDLYEHFVDAKFDIYCKEKENIVKVNDLCNERNKLYKMSQIDLYERAAVRNFAFNVDLSTIPKDPIGFIISVRRNNVVFVHTSFAEYFAASFLSKNRDFVVKFSDFLSEEKYNNIRFFFDLLLAKNCPVHVAVLYKNVQFLKNCDTGDLCLRDEAGRNALHLASSWGQKYQILRVTLRDKNRYYVDCRDDGRHHTLKPDSEEYCEIFNILTKVCNSNEIDTLFKMTALSYAQKSRCFMSFAKLLCSCKPNFDDAQLLCTIAYYSVAFDFAQIFDIIKEIPEIESIFFESLLHFAVIRNAVSCVKKLIKTDRDDAYLIVLASENGFCEIVKLFIDYGADVNQNYPSVFSLSPTPLFTACRSGHYDVVKLLVENGADVNKKFDFLFDRNTSALHVSVSNNYYEIAKLLINKGAHINKSGSLNSETPLQIMARKSRESDIHFVKLLIDKGADVNATDFQNRTPLHIACAFDNYAVVKILIKNEAIVNAQCDNEQTPLHVATDYRIIKCLTNNNADVSICDSCGNSPLYSAAEKGLYKSVKLQINAGASVNCQNKFGETPLHKACQSGVYDVVKLLVESGANVNIASIHGQTPLHCACQGQDLNSIQLLIDNEADVNARNELGETAIHWSCEQGNREIVKFLIDNGANINAVTDYSETSLDFARSSVEIVTLFESNGAQEANFEK